MKKTIISLLLLISIFGVSFANKTITLNPGWNVVSTPKLLSGIDFSNGGSGISFYTLSGSSWLSIIPTIGTIKPLEGFVVNNSTTGDVTMSLIYRVNVDPMETLFQKTLNVGWNILGITTVSNPFVNIGSGAVMSIDFTKNGVSNLLNGVNTSFTLNNLSSSVTNPELGEAYGVFVNTLSGTIYGGSQDTNSVSTNSENIQITNTYTGIQNIQEGATNVKLADLEFTTTGDVTLKLYSFKADISGTNRTDFDGAQITIYDSTDTALVSDTITSGDSQLDFTLPSTVNISNTNSVTFTLKLDQVSNAVVSGDTLQLVFATGNVNAKEIINNNNIYPLVSSISSILFVTDPALPTIINQAYSNILVKYGEQTTIGNVKIKSLNNDAVLKDIYFTLSGFSVNDMNKISSPVLYKSGVAIGALIKTGNNLYITNINNTMLSGVTNTYELKANIVTINTSGDVLPIFTTILSDSLFESVYGGVLNTVLTGIISNTIKVVNEIPTITAVTSYTKGNDVVYRITLNSVKEITLSGLVLSVLGTNLSGGNDILNGLTGILASDDLGTTVYKTALVASNALSLVSLDNNAIPILGTTDLYIIFSNAALLPGNGNTPVTVRLTTTDMSYNDIFDDNSKNAVNSVLSQYQSTIAGSLDLTTVTTIQ